MTPRPERLPLWVEERVIEILALNYSGPITLQCRDGRIKQVERRQVFTEPPRNPEEMPAKS